MSDGAPVRWRVDIEGVPGGLYESRAAAAYALRAVRSAGKRARLVRVTTVYRCWRVGGVRCRVFQGWCSRRWFWAAGEVDNVLDDDGVTYAEAIEAAERAARGQR